MKAQETMDRALPHLTVGEIPREGNRSLAGDTGRVQQLSDVTGVLQSGQITALCDPEHTEEDCGGNGIRSPPGVAVRSVCRQDRHMTSGLQENAPGIGPKTDKPPVRMQIY